MKDFVRKNIKSIIAIFVIALITCCVILNSNKEAIATNGTALSTKKIEWGIKREKNHEQPDLGSVNKRIIDEANRNCNGK